MQPTLYTGDLAVLQRRVSYLPGEIVAFRVKNGLVIHRIVGGSAELGYLTQGDNKKIIDPWQPRPDKILGRMWFHIPGGGRPLQNLRQPQYLLALGCLAALLFLDDTKKEKIRRRRKRMKSLLKSKSGGLQSPGWAMSLLGVTALITLLAAAAAIYGYLQPLERPETVERLRYEHQAAFQYTIHTEPSVLQPQEVIGPVGPGSGAAGGLSVTNASEPIGTETPPSEGEAEAIAGPPVFTALARSLDLDVAYQLSSPLPPDVQGEIGVDLQIQAGDGWTKTETLTPPSSFNGPSATTWASIDFRQILDFLNTVEEQTGFDPGTYQISLIPKVHLAGRIGDTDITDTFAPAFKLTINQTKIGLDPELSRSEVKKIEEQALRPNHVQLLQIAIPVAALRLGGLAVAVPGLILSILLAAVVILGMGMDEPSRLKARYRGLIVPAATSNLGAVQRVEVAAIQDLARLAQRDGSVIFHQTLRNGSSVYFVPDGQVVYTYRIAIPDPES